MINNILMDVVAEPNAGRIFTGAAGVLTAVVVVAVIAAAVAIIIRAVNKKNKDDKGE